MRPLNPNLVREAIASTAASHRESPNHDPESCDSCRAAAGDVEAYARIIAKMEAQRQRHETHRLRMGS